jgi:hypothetical protein
MRFVRHPERGWFTLTRRMDQWTAAESPEAELENVCNFAAERGAFGLDPGGGERAERDHSPEARADWLSSARNLNNQSEYHRNFAENAQNEQRLPRAAARACILGGRSWLAVRNVDDRQHGLVSPV